MDWVAILDFGSQYTQLIARRVRECKVYCEIFPYNVPLKEVLRNNPKAIILSGGPATVTQKEAPSLSEEIFEHRLPILGICYGMQLLAKLLGGEVESASKREYGSAYLMIDQKNDLFYGLNSRIGVWMSHGDRVTRIPPHFEILGHTKNSPIAAMGNQERRIYGVQFHPEVSHTPDGLKIIDNFLKRIARCNENWKIKNFVRDKIREIREITKGEKVICAVSGGVDSTVLSVLLHQAIGEKLFCIFVDNGLLRKNEAQEVIQRFKDFNIHLIYSNAKERFLRKLKGVVDPDEKRKTIGREFIRVFEKEAKALGRIPFLAQGTLYPDVIESKSAFGGPSMKIKTHHNVGGLPSRLRFKLIEPFKFLFKDEVREVGKELGLPESLIYRQPFPGPGLAVRIIGEVTEERLSILREVDFLIQEEIQKRSIYKKIWQVFGILLPVKTTGVMGDGRTYEHVAVIRAVTSQDGMTADWAKLPYRLLGTLSNRIINEVKGVNRVVYDISTKPPATIEWE